MPNHGGGPVLLAIRSIPASETYALRHAVLWPHQPLSYVQLPDDAAGQHFGAFILSSTTTTATTPTSTDTTTGEEEHGGDDEAKESSSKPVSIISLFITTGEGGTGTGTGEKQARFRKFATAASWQGRGIGSALLTHAIGAAARAGAKSIWCDARQSALPFYRKFGLDAVGGEEEGVFFKGGVPYLRMSKRLVD